MTIFGAVETPLPERGPVPIELRHRRVPCTLRVVDEPGGDYISLMVHGDRVRSVNADATAVDVLLPEQIAVAVELYDREVDESARIRD